MKCKLTLIYLLFAGIADICQAQFKVNNDATDLGGGYYRLTQNVLNQAGSVWYKVQHDLSTPLNVEGQMYLGTDDAGADGIAFVLQNNCLSAGSIGGGIGYGGMPGNSIAVEFDTFQNISGVGDQNNNDPAYDHLAIFKSGVVDHADAANNLFGPIQLDATKTDVEDGTWHDFRINYDPATMNLSVYFDNSLRVNFNYDIITNIFGGDSYVYWGFTSSTGGFSNEQQIYINGSASTYTLSDQTFCSGSVHATLPPLSRYSGENLALGKTALSSSDEAPGTAALNVLDGNNSTRWSSQFSDPQWIYVDLGVPSDVDSVILNWEGAYGSEYYIQTSTDAATWTNVFHETAGNGGIDKIFFTAANIRYVRMYGTTRATSYGYSLWEFEVYGLPKYVWSPDDGSIDDIYSESPTFTPTVTTTYTVLIPDPCNGPTPYNFTITKNCTPLPVEFATFQVNRNGNSSILIWETSTENNSGYFEIQKSSDGIHFTTIGFVNAAGNTSQTTHYSYTDFNSFDGSSYYRIKETDKDGAVYLSSIRVLSFEKATIKIRINSGYATIVSSFKSPQTIYYKVITLKGQTIAEGDVYTEAGYHEQGIRLPELAASYYIIQVYTEREYISEKALLHY